MITTELQKYATKIYFIPEEYLLCLYKFISNILK